MHKRRFHCPRTIDWPLFTLGHLLIKHGRLQESLEYMKKALGLDPLNPGRVWQSMAIAEFCLGNYEKAAAPGKRVREFNPTTTSVGGVLSISYVKLGQQQNAEEAFAHYKKGWPADHPPTIPLVMMFYNFVDPKFSETIVESMVKAGLPEMPSDYYKPWMLERLKEEKKK